MGERDESTRRGERRRRRPRRPRPISTVPSPCLSICRLDDETGLCQGCLRTTDEIRDWIILDDDGRRAILSRLAVRHARLGRNWPPKANPNRPEE